MNSNNSSMIVRCDSNGNNNLNQSPDAVQSYKKIFSLLDRNKDGQIDIDDLIEVFGDSHPNQTDSDRRKIIEKAQKLMRKADIADDSQISMLEFLEYCAEREKKLRITFHHLDKDEDGKISTADLHKHFQSLGMRGSQLDNLDKALREMDTSGDRQVEYNEFREFFMDTARIHQSEIEEFFESIIDHASIDFGTQDVLIREELGVKAKEAGEWWRHLAAGATAGATSRTCTAPLDRLKVFLQVHASSQNKLGIYTALRHMIEEGGYASLWRGNGMNVSKIVPEMALKFYTYEYAKRYIKGSREGDLTVVHRFVAGAMAGAFSQSCIYPLEVLKTRLVLRKTGQYKGVGDCVHSIIRSEGILAFYKGYVPNILGIMPYAGVDLAVYETLKRAYLKRLDKREPGVLEVLACGLISSTIGQLVSYPLALVRTKLQAQVTTSARVKETVIRLDPNLAVSRNASSGLYSMLKHNPRPEQDTMSSLFRHIWVTEGVPGYYRGILPNMMKVMPAVGISYVAYEKVRQFLGAQMT